VRIVRFRVWGGCVTDKIAGVPIEPGVPDLWRLMPIIVAAP
jgi:hypothetical protein